MLRLSEARSLVETREGHYIYGVREFYQSYDEVIEFKKN